VHLQKDWLAYLEDIKESLAGLFQHICLPDQEQTLQRLG